MSLLKRLGKIPKRKKLLYGAVVLLLIFLVALYITVDLYKKEPEITLLYLGGGIDPGNSANLEVRYEPDNSYHPPFKVESTNANVASVSDDLVVTAKRAGETTVTITTESGQSSSVDVTVNEKKLRRSIFLTYDDGPGSDVTKEVLKVLKKYKVKATFFVTGEYVDLHPEIVKQEVDEGHTVGVGTYGRDYTMIYQSSEAYLEDFDRAVVSTKKACGQDPSYWRFPGGRTNDLVDEKVEEEIMSELHRRGYTEMDWNCSVNDAVGIDYTTEEMVEYAIASINTALNAKTVPVVHLHDGAKNGSAAKITEGILKEFIPRGFKFKGLNEYTGPEISFEAE